MSSLGGGFNDAFSDTEYDDWGTPIKKDNKTVTIINYNHSTESDKRLHTSKPNHIRINELERRIEDLERRLNKVLKTLRNV